MNQYTAGVIFCWINSLQESSSAESIHCRSHLLLNQFTAGVIFCWINSLQEFSSGESIHCRSHLLVNQYIGGNISRWINTLQEFYSGETIRRGRGCNLSVNQYTAGVIFWWINTQQIFFKNWFYLQIEFEFKNFTSQIRDPDVPNEQKTMLKISCQDPFNAPGGAKRYPSYFTAAEYQLPKSLLYTTTDHATQRKITDKKESLEKKYLASSLKKENLSKVLYNICQTNKQKKYCLENSVFLYSNICKYLVIDAFCAISCLQQGCKNTYSTVGKISNCRGLNQPKSIKVLIEQ